MDLKLIEERHIELTGDFGDDISQIKWAFEKMSECKMIQGKTLNDLKDALSLIEDRNFSKENIAKFSEAMNSIKDSINLHLFNELNIVRKSTLDILGVIPRILKDELFKSLFITSDGYIDNISDSYPNRGDVYRNIHEQFFAVVKDTLLNFRLEILTEINTLKGADYLDSIQLIQSILLEAINEDIILLSAKISEEELKEIRQNIINKYPTVGKSNFSIFRNLKKIESDYIVYTKEKIQNKVIDYIKSNIDNYEIFGDIANDLVSLNSAIFRSGLKGYYKDFVGGYIDNLFEKIYLRKVNLHQPKVLVSEFPKSENKTIVNKENKCPQIVLDFLNKFIYSLDTLDKEKSLIRSYILRLHLKGKSIRIKDMIYNFPITKDLFTEDFVKQAKETGIVFENGNCKKEEEIEQSQPENKNTNPDTEENESPMQVEDAVKVAFEKKADWFLNNIKTFDGNGFVCIMKLAGYEVGNENHVSKCFNKLYHNTQMKQIFLDELKRNIFLQEKIIRKKSSYRKINIYQKKGHRILFLKNNKTIDGIYNHDDYEKRVDVFLGC